MHARTHACTPLLGFVEFIFFDARLWGGKPSEVFSRRGVKVQGAIEYYNNASLTYIGASVVKPRIYLADLSNYQRCLSLTYMYVIPSE